MNVGVISGTNKSRVLPCGSYAYLRITSDGLSLGEVSALVGAEPDVGWSVGESFRRERSTKELVRSFTNWERRSGMPAGAPLQAHLDALIPHAQAIAASIAGRDDVATTLQVVQHTADEQDLGFHLDSRWIAILASSRHRSMSTTTFSEDAARDYADRMGLDHGCRQAVTLVGAEMGSPDRE